MTSRRGSLARLDKELKARASNLPDGAALYQILIDLASPHPHPAIVDRTAAISGGAFIDHAIRRAITTHLRIGIEDKDTKSLFDGDHAPLGPLSARITMARALGIIGPQTTEDLHTLRTIRNTFAHTVLPIQFDDKEASDLCLSINHLRQTLPDGLTILEALKIPNEPYERTAFILAVAHYFLELMSYEPGIPEHLRPAHEPSSPSRDKSK